MSTSATIDLNRNAERTPGMPLGPILAFIALWFGISWLILGTALHPVLPGGWLTVGALALVSVLPL